MAEEVDSNSESGTGQSAHPPFAPYLWMLCGAFAFIGADVLGPESEREEREQAEGEEESLHG